MPVDTNTLLVIGLVIVVLLVLGAVLTSRRRSQQLQEHFGPEYDHTVETYGDRKKAEEELAARTERVQSLNIRDLTDAERKRYDQQWRDVQSKFVDNPSAAVVDADMLVQQVMEARGYPVGDFEQRAADISVDHPNVVSNYRSAHDIALRNKDHKANTEDLRQALIYYRALFDELLAAPSEEKQSVRRAA